MAVGIKSYFQVRKSLGLGTRGTLNKSRQVQSWTYTCATDWAFTLPSWHSVIDICIMLCPHDKVNAQSVARQLSAYRHISWTLYVGNIYPFSARYYYTILFSCHITPNYIDIHVFITHVLISTRPFISRDTFPLAQRHLVHAVSLSLTHYE